MTKDDTPLPITDYQLPITTERPRLDPERMALARAYARARRRLLLPELAVAAAYFAVWWGLVHGPWLAWLTVHVPGFDLRVVLYTGLFGLGAVLTGLPFEAMRHRLARRFGLSVQTRRAWLADQAKATAVAAVLGLPVVVVLYRLLAAAPQTWWLWMGLFYLGFSILLVQLAPVLIMPLFLTFTPLTDEPLAARLRQLAEAAGARVRGVFRTNLSSKTTAANAWLSGLGRTRRIVLGDTLLAHYTEDEILAVFAHELGHHVHQDLWRGIAAATAVNLAGFGLAGQVMAWAVTRFGYAGPADLAAFPWLALALTLFAALTTPLLNALSRRQERRADAYALVHGPGPAAFAAALTRLANQNLADPEPPAWLVWLAYSHPPILERIAYAEGQAGQKG